MRITRRDWLAGAGGALLVGLGCTGARAERPRLGLGLLHLDPVQGNLDANVALIEAGMRLAAARGAQWVLTPEMALPGYLFRSVLGLDWIGVQPDPWTARLAAVCRELRLVLFLGTAERDASTGLLHNTLLVLGPAGSLLGRHRKINVIPGFGEGWATPGGPAEPVRVGNLSVGMLICADAYNAKPAADLAQRGAQLLVSGAAWMPGEMGPDGAWEDRTRETGLPLVVCNRTGVEEGMDWREAESVAIQGGQRVMNHFGPGSRLLREDLLLDDRTWSWAGLEPLAF